MKPTVGRVVHYTNVGDADGRYPPEEQAAIITKVRNQPQHEPGTDLSNLFEETQYAVSLCVLYETGTFFMQNVPFCEHPLRGHWSWPVREPG